MSQVTLDLVVRDHHGCCTVNFSKGRRVRCTLMARDGLWHDGSGATIAEAIEDALAAVNDPEFVETLRKIRGKDETSGQ